MILTTLHLDPAELERRTGWQIKPEGACKGDRCVPLPASSLHSVDVCALVERLGMPLRHAKALDVQHTMSVLDHWYTGFQHEPGEQEPKRTVCLIR